MAKVKILFQGYTSGEANGHTCSTVVLVQDKDKNGTVNIISDPGSLPNKNNLITALKKENLTPADINFVFLTHQHLDHFMYLGLFENAKIIFNDGMMKNDFWEPMQELIPDEGCITKDIKIIKTPGHSDDSITLLVKTKVDGKNSAANGKNSVVAICGDVFWKKDYPEKDKYANNLKQLEKSRKKLLELADYIIPGHGGMFRVGR
jgi:glyoxylase-like metal-dependent hydrolase (beta-lactamase superfamily II)